MYKYDFTRLSTPWGRERFRIHGDPYNKELNTVASAIVKSDQWTRPFHAMRFANAWVLAGMARVWTFLEEKGILSAGIPTAMQTAVASHAEIPWWQRTRTGDYLPPVVRGDSSVGNFLVHFGTKRAGPHMMDEATDTDTAFRSRSFRWTGASVSATSGEGSINDPMSHASMKIDLPSDVLDCTSVPAAARAVSLARGFKYEAKLLADRRASTEQELHALGQERALIQRWLQQRWAPESAARSFAEGMEADGIPMAPARRQSMHRVFDIARDVRNAFNIGKELFALGKIAASESLLHLGLHEAAYWAGQFGQIALETWINVNASNIPVTFFRDSIEKRFIPALTEAFVLHGLPLLGQGLCHISNGARRIGFGPLPMGEDKIPAHVIPRFIVEEKISAKGEWKIRPEPGIPKPPKEFVQLGLGTIPAPSEEHGLEAVSHHPVFVNAAALQHSPVQGSKEINRNSLSLAPLVYVPSHIAPNQTESVNMSAIVLPDHPLWILFGIALIHVLVMAVRSSDWRASQGTAPLGFTQPDVKAATLPESVASEPTRRIDTPKASTKKREFGDAIATSSAIADLLEGSQLRKRRVVPTHDD
jgi:hypothetical protein